MEKSAIDLINLYIGGSRFNFFDTFNYNNNLEVRACQLSISAKTIRLKNYCLISILLWECFLDLFSY